MRDYFLNNDLKYYYEVSVHKNEPHSELIYTFLEICNYMNYKISIKKSDLVNIFRKYWKLPENTYSDDVHGLQTYYNHLFMKIVNDSRKISEAESTIISNFRKRTLF
jgi:hypothetical protein